MAQMSEAQALNRIAAELGAEWDVAAGKWFGMPCLKVGGNVFAALWQGDLACKLSGEAHAEALHLDGARLFDPRGQAHPLKEWVQIPAEHAPAWSRYARLACAYVAGAAQAVRDGLIAGLVQARRKILDQVRLLAPDQQDQVFLGEWSVKDLLAHLEGWDHTNRDAVGEILAGRKPGFWVHYDRAWRRYNAQLVAQYRRENLAEMVAEVERSHLALIEYLETIPADEYLKRKPIQSLLRAETSDEEEHARQLEAFRTGRAT
jgi:hypothetical protein